MSEQDERDRAVAEALTWERTPFHDCANIKSVGVDCANFVYEVYRNCGLVDPHYKVPDYTAQFLLHSDRELFLEVVELFCRRVEDREPRPGDLLMYRYGRCFSHGALVTAPPAIIHARKLAGFVVRGDAQQDAELRYLPGGAARPRRLYTIKPSLFCQGWT